MSSNHSTVFFYDILLSYFFIYFFYAIIDFLCVKLKSKVKLKWKLVSRKPFSRIFCSTSFRFIDKSKKSFCAECFEIVLNGYFFVLKRLKKV
ncbi:hypothetical protein BpHYR1_006190 [Brachionus plicatilis]|uniref:Uncharacterized protein n=1 Tax=Brachionus plicatilis TaxID=10195 RepID=A0A3M7RQU2_BRAPC|nr:hypothetical protein BpHYR1_006190 [Brachionus plicatilis]